MDPASLDSQIMTHEGCDEMEDEGEKELPDLGLGANVVHDSDDEDNAVATMLAELPPPPTRPFWGGREYFAAARPLANQLEQLSTMASGWIVKLSNPAVVTAALRDDIDKWMIAAAVQQSKMQSRLEPDPWTGFQETVNYRPLYDLDFEEHTDLIARYAILARVAQPATSAEQSVETEPVSPYLADISELVGDYVNLSEFQVLALCFYRLSVFLDLAETLLFFS